MEASEGEKSSIGQFKKTRRGSEDQDRQPVSQSMAQGSKGLLKKSASKTVLQVRAQKFDPTAVEGQPGLPLMDEILVEALGKVAVKSLVTGKALVDYVAKNYPEFVAKEVWIRKLKAALDMEVARGNLLLVTSFKPIYNIIF